MLRLVCLLFEGFQEPLQRARSMMPPGEKQSILMPEEETIRFDRAVEDLRYPGKNNPAVGWLSAFTRNVVVAPSSQQTERRNRILQSSW